MGRAFDNAMLALELRDTLKQALSETELAKTEAVKAGLAKSNFISNVSHELRTPLNAIIGMAHLLHKSGLSPRQQDYLGKIQRSSQHLLGIIAQKEGEALTSMSIDDLRKMVNDL